MLKRYFLTLIIPLLLIIICGTWMLHMKDKKREESSFGTSGMNKDFEQNVAVEENGVKVNVNENINQEIIVVDEFDITNISLFYANGMTNFTAKINNNSEKNYDSGLRINICFYAENGSLIAKLPAVTNTLMAGEEGNINAKITVDCTNANDISFSIENK